MIEFPAQDITVRTHLFAGGEGARGAIFVGGLGAFRFAASRNQEEGWTVTFASEPEMPKGLHEHLVAAALSSIGVAEGLFRHPPPRILTVSLDDLQEEVVEPVVDVRDIFPEVGIAQGFVGLPGKGRFTFQADRRAEREWDVAFGLDFSLPEDLALQLERVVLDQIEEALREQEEA